MSETSLESKPEVTKSDIIRLAGTLIALAFSFYSFVGGESGNGIASLLLSILLSWSEVERFKYTRRLRWVFARSGHLARKLLFALAVCGSLLVIDVLYGLDILPDYADTAFKRIGPAFFIVTIVLFFSSLLSAVIAKDIGDGSGSLSRMESFYYLTILIFCVFLVVLFSGLPVENIYKFTSQNDPKVLNFEWSSEQIKLHGLLIGVSLVWSIAFYLIIVSKIVEIKLQIRL